MSTIQRNEISGQHEHVTAPLGKGHDYGRNEIVKREQARKAALEAAIAEDSSKGAGGQTLKHPTTDVALERMRNEPGRWQPEHSEKQYRAVHGADPNAKQSNDDTGALSGRETPKGVRDSGPSDYNISRDIAKKAGK